MGMFKNEVGRPSNETIKKRNIFKGICVLLVLIIIGLVAYILNDKGIIEINKAKENNKDNNNEVVTTTVKDKKEERCIIRLSRKEEKVVELWQRITKKDYINSTKKP